jgi:ABC-type dipeptide/oligopeptide/nickel transport system permease component/ABC-type dipeptide/oligopeptide/nickel transport system permease subunit
MIILPSARRVCVRAIAGHLIKHLFRLIVVLFGVFSIIFIIPHLAPGGPERALIGWPYTAERAATLRAHYGFDQPLYEQYGRWLRNGVEGEWGRSKFTGRPVIREVEFTLPLTLKLLGEIVCLTVLIGALFALAAIYPRERPYTGRGQGLCAMADVFPDFYGGILMKFFFVWHLEWFPVGGFAFFAERPWQAYRQLLLPALSVAVLYGLIIGPRVAARLVAAGRVSDQGVVAPADLTNGGCGRVWGRALGHSAVVLLQSAPWLLGSVMLAEKIFSIPGFGDFGIEAFVRRDYPKIQAFLIIIVGAYAIMRALVDGIEAARTRHHARQAAKLSDEPAPKSPPGFGRLIMQDKFFLGAVLVLALAATTVFASSIAPYLPDEVHMKDRLQPPTTQYWMGTDLLGRDILSRVIHGGRQALMVAGASATGALLLACILGCLPRLARHAGVALMTPLVRVIEAFPPLLLGLLLMTLLGQGHWQEMVALTAALTPPMAATFLLGDADGRQRIFPAAGLMVALWLHAVGSAIILEATLNFLDIGLLPLIPSWGGDLKANLPYLHVNPAIVLFPGMAVVVSALGFGLMAQSVQQQTVKPPTL